MVMDQVETLRAACCIAGLDEHIAASERSVLDELARRVGVGKASLDAMIGRAKRDGDFYEQQFRIIKTDAEATMQKLLSVAMADQQLTVDERVVLAHFAEKLGMEAKRFDALLAAAEKQLK